MHHLVSAWTLFCRLAQCVALVFFLSSIDFIALEKGFLRGAGIL